MYNFHYSYSVKSHLPQQRNKVEMHMNYHLKVFGNASSAKLADTDNISQDTLHKEENDTVVEESIDSLRVDSAEEHDRQDTAEEKKIEAPSDTDTDANEESEPKQVKESFLTKGLNLVGKVKDKIKEKVVSLFQATEKPILYHEKTLENQFTVSCDERKSVKVAYIVKLNIKKCDEISLSLSLKNCILEDIHLFERFV